MEINTNGKKRTNRSKKSGTKASDQASREPKLNQKYKQSINPSKRHRDRLNGELDNLAKLLPFPEDVIARLDKLSILRLSVSYLRNKNFFKGSSKPKSKEPKTETNSQFSFLFNEALDGFVLVVTLDGEIFYVSEGVKDYLGYSQSQILHQPLETLVHDDDREELTSHLKGAPPKIEEINENDETENDNEKESEPRDFILRLKSVLNTSSTDMYKPFKLSGTVRKLNMEPDVETLKYALFAFCTPARSSYSMLEIRMKSTLFCSKNRIDLSFLDLDARGKEFFGYSKKDIFGRSSYVLVHRQDAQHVRCKHTEIITCGKTSLATFRLMNKNNEWNWVCGYGRVLFKNGKPDFLVTTNRIMSEEEGMAMMKLRDDADRKSLARLGLMEPDDSAKALELGFPRHNNPLQQYDSVLMDAPVPMSLPDLAPLEASVFMKREAIAASTKEEPGDLLKDAFFDVDVPERFLDSSADQVMNDPLSNLSPEDFHSSSRSAQSPVESVISDRTNHTNGSRHSHVSSTSSVPSRPFQSGIDKINFQMSFHQVPQKPFFTDLTPVAGSSSSTVSLSPHNPTQQQQNFHHGDPSLFDDLHNLDLLQQQHVHPATASNSSSMKLYPFGSHSPIYPNVESFQRVQQQQQHQHHPHHPQQRHSQQQQVQNLQQQQQQQQLHQQQQHRLMQEQDRTNINYVRSQYNSPNSRIPLPVNDHVAPNITLPYDVGNGISPQMELHHMRNDTHRQYNTFPYSYMHTENTPQPGNWARNHQQNFLQNNNHSQFLPWLPVYES